MKVRTVIAAIAIQTSGDSSVEARRRRAPESSRPYSSGCPAGSALSFGVTAQAAVWRYFLATAAI
jgi:hypothetical protein